MQRQLFVSSFLSLHKETYWKHTFLHYAAAIGHKKSEAASTRKTCAFSGNEEVNTKSVHKENEDNATFRSSSAARTAGRGKKVYKNKASQTC